jgi:hypothetical protein
MPFFQQKYGIIKKSYRYVHASALRANASVSTTPLLNRGVQIVVLMALSVSMAIAQRIPRKSNLGDELPEISGLTRTADGRLWGLNDSGNAPILYEIDPYSGATGDFHLLPIPNRDWEELQADAYGNLWIADIGNNANRRKNLCFFRYNPVSGHIDSLRFRYPDQYHFPPAAEADWQFDGEAFVWWNDTLHLFTKSRFNSDNYTKHYTLVAQAGEQVAVLRDSLRIRNRAVTAAALSPNGKELALTAYLIRLKWGFWPQTRAQVYYFNGYNGTQYLKVKPRRKRLPKAILARQFESITYWNERYYLVANEQIKWQRQRLWRIRH